mmetsp:Transcript_17198/g.25871  ORF Transcript_17198/g.25871 Transcript_17198/m.25871 type:complete len:126 (+) Transcript_17198:81-458(+)
MELVQPLDAAPCPLVVLDRAVSPVVVLSQEDDSTDASTSKITWTRPRDVALLGQIAKKGKAAFETKRGGLVVLTKTKAGAKVPTQEQVCVDVSTRPLTLCHLAGALAKKSDASLMSAAAESFTFV